VSNSTRLTWAAVLAVSGLLVSAWSAPGGASATSAADWGPGFKACGHFRAEYTIHVFAKGVTCSKARRIQMEYWLGAPSGHVEVNHGGPVYILLKRFPGWKCFSGTGGGSCTKGHKVAAYSDI
jgi:hypothetical protein